MIALVRVRYPTTAANAVWSDMVTNNWMNASIPFSLAHFWQRTSLFQADLSYFLFAPVVVADPRITGAANNVNRPLLVNAILAEVTRAYSPDWNTFDKVLIVGAQRLDQFGGGSYQVPVGGGTKNVSVAVVDVLSPFSNVCQELGHAFGLEHEMNTGNDEYQSPYSVMSSESYGGGRPSFERAVMAQLPVGKPRPSPEISAVNTQDVQRIVGPYITPVQFSVANMGTFNDPQTVYQVPVSIATQPHSFRLTAVDACIDSWPMRRRMLAVLPPQVPNGDLYYLELRRNRSYDAGLSVDGSVGPQNAVVIHAVNQTTKRVMYVGRIPLASNTGDTDYHSYKGFFAVRLGSVEPDHSECQVTVGGGDFWKYFGVAFTDVVESFQPHVDIGWQTADMSPCFLFPPSPHQYRNHFQGTTVSVGATSFGYEQPVYRWFLEDVALDPAGSTITLPLHAKHEEKGELSDARTESITFRYLQSGSTLKLICNDPFASIAPGIKVQVSEASPEVLKSFYPERSIWTNLRIDNLSIEHDQRYIDEQKACAKRIRGINDRFSLSNMEIPHGVDPGPRFGVDTIDLINALVLSNPVAANAAINEVAKLRNIGRLDVIKHLR